MGSSSKAILIGDTDADAARELTTGLGDDSVRVRRVETQSEVCAELDAGLYDLLIADVAIVGGEIERFLDDTARRWPDIPVILTSGRARPQDAVEAVRGGASDFLKKPLDWQELSFSVRKAFATVELGQDAPPPSVRAPLPQHRGPNVIGDSIPMRQVLELVVRAAQGTATVLLRGESGTGKEVFARRLHELSPRQAGPFVKVHCAALPEQLLESELFGYEKGAFTGAASRKPGRVELADGGTLFLDEIGDISPATQVKLLRVIQDKEYERLGGTQTLKSNVRFIAATHRNLEDMVARGAFREDLYYRLNVVPIVLPPLRERTGDVEALVTYFCSELGVDNGKPNIRIAPPGVELMKRHPWPGNVRQLQNFIERLVVLADGDLITPGTVQRELPPSATSAQPSDPSHTTSALDMTFGSGVIELDAAVRRAEKRALEKALRKANGNKTVAARILNVSRRTLYNKIQEHGLDT